MKKMYKQTRDISWWISNTLPIFLVLALLVISTPVDAQNISVKGIVMGVDKSPLIGATVAVKGGNKGVVTDLDGKFSLQCSAGSTLVFTYIGYVGQDLKATENMTVILKDDAQTMEDIVVLGYGTNVKRVDVIGSVSSVNAAQIATKAPVSVLDALQGEMAGVQITSSSGAPGASVTIRVRGLSTIEGAGASPLYIVDGIMQDNLDNISPDDIQTLDVLKDAASASIYGARAANGVVMVTTKSAVTGKPRIDVRFVQSFGYMANTLPQLNRKEADILSNSIVSAGSKDQFYWFKSNVDSCGLASTTVNDYQDVISQVAKRSEVGLSASGGSEKIKYYTSINYLNDKGIILTSYLKRATAKVKVDYTPYKFMTLTTNIQFAYEDKNNISEGSTFYNAIRRMPQTALYYPADGAYLPAWATYPNTGKRNPLIELLERDDVSKKYSATFFEGVELRLHRDIKLVGRATANYYHSGRERYASAYTNTNRTDYEEGKDRLQNDKWWSANLQADAYVDYSHVFGQNHNFHAMVGTQVESSTIDKTILDASYLISNSVLIPNMSQQPEYPVVDYQSDYRTASFFGRVDYNWKSRYLFSATMRYDGSSRFGTERRWGFFPSLQAGWRFSDTFLDTKVHDILTDAKLRASWGIVGNDRIGNFDSQTMFDGGMINGYNNITGVSPNKMLGNAFLQWEETQSTDVGIDLLFLGGRFSFVGDYYTKTTSQLLDDDKVPPEHGYDGMRVNVGKIANHGIELTVAGNIIEKRDWTWRTSLNWSYNKNTVKEIAAKQGQRLVGSNNNWFVQVGLPAGLFYGYKNLGVYPYDASNAYTPDFKERLVPVFERDGNNNVRFDADLNPILKGYNTSSGQPYNGEVKRMEVAGAIAKGGDVIWDDRDRSGIINDDDKQILGSAYPDWYAGWTNTVNYKNFSLNFSIYVNKGGLIYNQLLYDMSKFGDNTSACDPRAAVQGWRFQGQQTDWYAPGNKVRTTNNERQLNSFYLEDGTYIRLQNVRLAYQFDQKIANKLFVKNIQVYVYGNNLLTWTNYRGYDPEISTGGVLDPGADTQKYPRNREVGFGLNIGF